MRRRLAGTALAAALAAAAPAVAGGEDPAAYVAGIEDLPLMAGLEEVEDAGVTFDKPAGRIVEAYAHGAVDRTEVRGFYDGTLPQLGWRRSGPDRFRREDEVLELTYLGDDGDLTVHFSLQPK